MSLQWKCQKKEGKTAKKYQYKMRFSKKQVKMTMLLERTTLLSFANERDSQLILQAAKGFYGVLSLCVILEFLTRK